MMNKFRELQKADPTASLNVEVLSIDSIFDELFVDIISGSPEVDEELAPFRLGRRPEILRRRQRVLFAAAAAVIVLVASLSVVLTGNSLSGPTTTPYRAARTLPSGTHVTSPHGASGSWQLVGDLISSGWQQNTSGPPPGALTCPTTSACYSLAGEYASANVNAPLLSDSLYFSNDFGVTWSVLPLPSGFVVTTGLTCADSLNCSAGGDINGQAVFITTNDGGHQWTINPLNGLSGELMELTCSSASVCHGVIGPTWLEGQQRLSAAYLRAVRSDEAPRESIVTTADRGASWTSEFLPPANLVSGLTCFDESNCVVIGIQSISLRTITRHPTFGPNAGKSVKAKALIPRGDFVRSTSDGGTTWTTGTLPSTSPIREISQSALSCSTASDCVALGLITVPNIDQCQGPNQNPPPAFANSGCSTLATISVSDLIVTHDAGATWQTRTFPADVPLPSMSDVSCSSANNCWVSGSDAVPVTIGNTHDGGSAVMLGTTDGGLTWSKVTFAVPAGAPNYDGQSFQSIGTITCPTANACIALGAVAQGSKSTPVYSFRANQP